MSNTPTKQKSIALTLVAALSAAGAAVAAWQTQMFFQTRSGMGELHSFCNINATFDCTAVEMSKYAELWSGYPLSGLAIAGYFVILILALFGFSERFQNGVRKYLIFFSAIAVLFSAAYLAVMIAMIGKLCLLCLCVDAINVVLLVLAFKLPSSAHSKGADQLTLSHLAGIGAASLVIALLLSKAVDPQAEIKKEDLNDMVESVMNTPAVSMTIPTDAATVGKQDAPITIVKFSDYQCPGCKMAANAIHPLMKRYPDQVRFVFMNYPLDSACNPEAKHRMHPLACEAASVAVCAQEQGKFINAYEILFENQKDLTEGKIADLISNVPGIKIDQLKSCMSQPSTLAKIKSDVAFGTTLHIASTPTFFINGKKIEGGLPTSLWIEVIEKLLKK